MRPLQAEPFCELEGRRVVCKVDGQSIRGRLLAVRDGFLTLAPDRGPRVILNKYEISSLSEEIRPASRCPKVTSMFWK